MVGGTVDTGGVRGVGAAIGVGVRRDADEAQGGGVAPVPGVDGGDDDAGVVAHGYGDVRPPVDQRLAVGVVGEDGMHVERAVHHDGVDAPHEPEHALVLPHPQDLLPVWALDDASEDRRRRQRPVTSEPEVPFGSAGEPGVAQGEVADLQWGGLVQHLLPVDDERPEPATEVEQERGGGAVIGDDCRTEVRRFSDTVVGALGVVRENGPPPLLGAPAEHRQVLVAGSSLASVVEDGQAVAGPGRGDVVREFAEGHGAQGAHTETLSNLATWWSLNAGRYLGSRVAGTASRAGMSSAPTASSALSTPTWSPR